MAALSVLAATKPNQTEPNQTKGCQKYTAKNGERKAIRQGGCDGFGHISKGERVKRARGKGEGEALQGGVRFLLASWLAANICGIFTWPLSGL